MQFVLVVVSDDKYNCISSLVLLYLLYVSDIMFVQSQTSLYPSVRDFSLHLIYSTWI